MNKNDQKFMAEKIRSEYIARKDTKLDALRVLDTQVKRPAKRFAYIFGTAGAIIMGAGMSLVLTDIGNAIGLGESMVPGIIVGVCGMVIAIVNYPIYKRFLQSRKNKYASEILRISESIIKENQ